jgi:hypothetical protein
MNKPALNQIQYEGLLDYIREEVFPWIENHCIPDMKDVKVKGDKFSEIFIERQDFLVLQALSILEKEIKNKNCLR